MLNVNVSSSLLAGKEVEPKPLDSQDSRTHRTSIAQARSARALGRRALHAFVVADLLIDLVLVSAHVRPRAGEIFCFQPWIQTQEIGLRRAKSARLLQHPHWNASANDDGLTAAGAVHRIDARIRLARRGILVWNKTQPPAPSPEPTSEVTP